MRRKALSIALAAYSFLWLSIIVPGHRRGAVSFDRDKSCCDCCCCAHPADKAPVQNNHGHCAICDFAAHLTLPPPVDFTLPPMGLLARLPPPAISDLIARLVLTPFDGRGPPMA